MNQNKPLNNFNSFVSYLTTLRDNDGILSLEEVQKAKDIAENLENTKEIPHALDFLKSETTKYGATAAKYFYSYGSELKLSNILKTVKDRENQEWLSEIFAGKNEISLEIASKFSPEEKTRLIKLAEEALTFYKESSKKSRAARNPDERTAAKISNFCSYLKTYS
jgi:hypothetical protein